MTRRSLAAIALLVATTLSTLAAAMAPTSGEAAKAHRRHVKTEVVGGQDVSDSKYPFVAALGTVNESGGFDQFFCGGSLIAPSYVLTAAHCVVGATSEDLAVLVGQTVFGSNQGEARTLASIAIHPGYTPNGLVNDVAVLTLQQPILGVAPALLVSASDGSFEGAGSGLTVVGWGDTVRFPHPGRQGNFPARLQETTVSVVGDDTCSKQWRRVGFKRIIVTPLMVCATGRRAGFGDSGSPLFATVNGIPVQVSLVSGGFAGGGKRNVSDFGPRLSDPAIAGFIRSAMGA